MIWKGVYMPIETEKVIKRKEYKCEHCGTTHRTCSHFKECIVCGKEVCTNCGESVRLYRIDWDGFSEEYLAHKDCMDPCYSNWEYAYLSEIKRLEDELYKNIEELNRNYVKGDDEIMREIAHKNNATWC